MVRSRRMVLWVGVVWLAAIAAFLSASLVSERVLARIGGAADSIATNAGPSVQKLSAMRTDLLRVQAGLAALDETDDRSVHRAAAMSMREILYQLRRNWTAYARQPAYPGEHSLMASVETDLRRLERLADELARQVGQGASSASTRPRVADATGIIPRLDTAFAELLDLNASSLEALAARIERIRQRQLVLTITLDVLAALASLITGLLAINALRRHQRLLEARANELEAFAGRVSHDLFNPLATATIALDLADAGTTEPTIKRAIASGRKGLVSARSVADAMLAFARAGACPDVKARARVDEVIRAVTDDLRLLADEQDVQLVVDEPAAATVACAPGLLTSAIENLVGNAIKYMGDSATRLVTVRAAWGAGTVRVEVEDTGPGLPPRVRARAFQPFVRGGDDTTSGIGLGLATVERIVTSHRGSVDVESRPGGGSRFWFELPMAEEVAPSDKIAGEPAPPRRWRRDTARRAAL